MGKGLALELFITKAGGLLKQEQFHQVRNFVHEVINSTPAT